MTAASPLERARERGVSEVLHFTTSNGLIGILSAEQVLSHQTLKEDEYLEQIMVLNSPSRARDREWLTFVNLSISTLNAAFLRSSKRWHEGSDIWWAVLSFDVEIVGHSGVQFATTNNIYPSVRQGSGAAGFEALFAPEVAGRYSAISRRTPDTPTWRTTDPQAELLYPGGLSLVHLRKIYVPEPDNLDDVRSWLDVFRRRSNLDLSAVEVVCAPEMLRT